MFFFVSHQNRPHVPMFYVNVCTFNRYIKCFFFFWRPRCRFSKPLTLITTTAAVKKWQPSETRLDVIIEYFFIIKLKKTQIKNIAHGSCDPIGRDGTCTVYRALPTLTPYRIKSERIACYIQMTLQIIDHESNCLCSHFHFHFTWNKTERRVRAHTNCSQPASQWVSPFHQTQITKWLVWLTKFASAARTHLLKEKYKDCKNDEKNRSGKIEPMCVFFPFLLVVPLVHEHAPIG